MEKIQLQNCNTIDKRHTAYNGRAVLHKLRTISHRQHPGKRRKRPWADTTKLGPGKIPKSSSLLIRSCVGGEGSSLLPAHVYRAVLISRPCSSTALTHGVDMIRGLPLHGAACERARGGGGGGSADEWLWCIGEGSQQIIAPNCCAGALRSGL